MQEYISHLGLHHFDFHKTYTSCKMCKHKLIKKNTAMGLIQHMKGHRLPRSSLATSDGKGTTGVVKENFKFSKCILCKDLTFFLRQVIR